MKPLFIIIIALVVLVGVYLVVTRNDMDMITPVEDITATTTDEIVIAGDNEILFEQRSGWGPCPEIDGCFEFLTLYHGGHVMHEIPEGTFEKTLDASQVQIIRDLIVGDDLMNVSCEFIVTVDLWVSTTLNHNGETREFTFPECEEELEPLYTAIMEFAFPVE